MGLISRLPSCVTLEENLLLSKMILRLFKNIQESFHKKEKHEENLKTYLIYNFSFFGSIFFFGFGMLDTSPEHKELIFLLFTGSAIFFINLFFLKFTSNYKISGHVVLYMTFALMVYLVYTGGIDNSGPLWISCLPAVVILLHGLKQGIIELLSFLAILTFILYYPDNAFLATEYTEPYKMRIILSFLVMLMLSAIYGYFRELSLDKMRSLQKELRFYLRRDELTGLYNRRGYRDKAASNNQSFTTVLMCDIDYFKKINDTYGHLVGDYTIKEISNCINNTLRKKDIAVRWGGEEFLILLSNTTIEDAYMVSEKLRKTIESLVLSYENKITFKTTLSVGIKEIEEGMSLENAIKEADNAMYTSKRDGRNRCTIAKKPLSKNQKDA